MNKLETIAVIGDIHGCNRQLKELYSQILNFTDEVFSVGDLIVRGPESKKVIQFCKDKNIKPVMGNHEDMLLSSIDFENRSRIAKHSGTYLSWLMNGGDYTIKNYINTEKEDISEFVGKFIDCGHYEFIKNLPLIIETEQCIISHGGILTGRNKENALVNRHIPSRLEKVQIKGHTPEPNVLYSNKHFISIDTGCVFWGKLSAVILYPDGRHKILSSN